MKSTIIAAAAVALVGIGAIGGTSVAGGLKLKPGCWPGFMESSIMSNSYSCRKTFNAVCKKGYMRQGPHLFQYGGGKARVAYSCIKLF